MRLRTVGPNLHCRRQTRALEASFQRAMTRTLPLFSRRYGAIACGLGLGRCQGIARPARRPSKPSKLTTFPSPEAKQAVLYVLYELESCLNDRRGSPPSTDDGKLRAL